MNTNLFEKNSNVALFCMVFYSSIACFLYGVAFISMSIFSNIVLCVVVFSLYRLTLKVCTDNLDNYPVYLFKHTFKKDDFKNYNSVESDLIEQVQMQIYEFASEKCVIRLEEDQVNVEYSSIHRLNKNNSRDISFIISNVEKFIYEIYRSKRTHV